MVVLITAVLYQNSYISNVSEHPGSPCSYIISIYLGTRVSIWKNLRALIYTEI